VHPGHGGLPLKYAGTDGESVRGLVGNRTGARGDWSKLKSCTRLPMTGSSSRTSGRGSGRPSVFGLRRAPPKKSSSMDLK
jgi:hypothetical protein